MKLGIERLLTEKARQNELKGRRVAYLGHAPSVTQKLTHGLDELMQIPSLQVTCAFGPQHGMKGDKQDNMIESEDEVDARYNIPVFSLYSQTRQPTSEMMQPFDILLVDLQDVGCRIYTFLTTLCYVLEACSEHQKTIWVLDRPNPAGREVEGSYLKPGWESFVGIGPLPMRHGLTLGEAALWYQKEKNLDVDLKLIEMQDYSAKQGWPQGFSWVNPSPNIPRLSTTHAYAGTVLLEGTELSEGRGTTRPLEVFGHPQLERTPIQQKLSIWTPEILEACILRECFFEPTFHKFQGQLVKGFQVHTDGAFYNREQFKPYRLLAAFLKAVRITHPDLPLWKKPPYEYEYERAPIDLLSGGSFLREWVEDSQAVIKDLENFLHPDEKNWHEERHKFLIY